MKEHYFQYALITLVVILGLMLFGAVVFMGSVQGENEALKEENQRLEKRLNGINDEIRVLSDLIEEMMGDVEESEDWNKEAF